jgi:hypothetical protein
VVQVRDFGIEKTFQQKISSSSTITKNLNENNALKRLFYTSILNSIYNSNKSLNINKFIEINIPTPMFENLNLINLFIENKNKNSSNIDSSSNENSVSGGVDVDFQWMFRNLNIADVNNNNNNNNNINNNYNSNKNNSNNDNDVINNNNNNNNVINNNKSNKTEFEKFSDKTAKYRINETKDDFAIKNFQNFIFWPVDSF